MDAKRAVLHPVAIRLPAATRLRIAALRAALEPDPGYEATTQTAVIRRALDIGLNQLEAGSGG